MTCPPCNGNCDQGRDCDGAPLTFAESVLVWGVITIAAVVFCAIVAVVLSS